VFVVVGTTVVCGGGSIVHSYVGDDMELSLSLVVVLRGPFFRRTRRQLYLLTSLLLRSRWYCIALHCIVHCDNCILLFSSIFCFSFNCLFLYLHCRFCRFCILYFSLLFRRFLLVGMCYAASFDGYAISAPAANKKVRRCCGHRYWGSVVQ